MNRRRAAAALVLVLAVTQGTRAQQGDETIARGAELYVAKCSFCHDAVPEGTALAALPGVASLQLKYGGERSPYIRERPDLANAAVLGSFLRNGAGSMPPFRKTEISDADIASIAAYFARTSTD